MAKNFLEITQKKWDSLNPDQRIMASQLGVVVKNAEKIKGIVNKVSVIKPYTLALHISCELCYSKFYEYYTMILQDEFTDEPFLKSIRTARESVTKIEKTERRTRTTCIHCVEILSKLSKEVIIIKLMTYSNALGPSYARKHS